MLLYFSLSSLWFTVGGQRSLPCVTFIVDVFWTCLFVVDFPLGVVMVTLVSCFVVMYAVGFHVVEVPLDVVVVMEVIFLSGVTVALSVIVVLCFVDVQCCGILVILSNFLVEAL